LYTRFRGGIFSAAGAQNTAPKPSSAIKNIVCTFGGGILSATGAGKHCLHFWGRHFQHCRRSKCRPQTAFSNRKHCTFGGGILRATDAQNAAPKPSLGGQSPLLRPLV